MSKLRKIHVIIIGCAACALVVAGLFFLVIKPANERIAGVETELQAATEVANRLASDQRKLVQVKDEYNRQVTAYSRFVRAKMPAITLADRPQGMVALWKEQAEVLGPMLERWPGKTGVRLFSSVKVPAAPTDPNAISTTLVQIDIGTFQVMGDFHAIMKHVRKWNGFNRLVQLTPVSISGRSPFMIGEYGVTVFLVPSGEAGPTFQMSSPAVASNPGTGTP
jgi:hypothetical protein